MSAASKIIALGYQSQMNLSRDQHLHTVLQSIVMLPAIYTCISQAGLSFEIFQEKGELEFLVTATLAA